MIKYILGLFTSVSVSNVINILKSLIVVKVLSPSSYGILKMLEIISQLSRYGSLGFIEIARREIPYYRGAELHDTAERVKVSSFYNEISLGILLSVIALSTIPFYDAKQVQVGIIGSAIFLFVNKLFLIFQANSTIHKEFKSYSISIIIFAATNLLLISISIKSYGYLAVVYSPIVSALIAIWYLTVKTKYRLTVRFDKQELVRQIREGYPFSLKKIAYGAYQWSERTVIFLFFGVKYVGFWGLSNMIMTYMKNYGMLFSQVWQPYFMEDLGRNGLKRSVEKINTLLKIIILIEILVIGTSYVLIPEIILAFLPKYTQSIIFLKFFLSVTFVWIPVSYINIILSSKELNQQLNIFFSYLTGICIFLFSSVVLKYLNIATITNVILADTISYHAMAILFISLYTRSIKSAFKGKMYLYSMVYVPILVFSAFSIINYYTANVLISASLYVLSIVGTFGIIKQLYLPTLSYRDIFATIKKLRNGKSSMINA